MTERDRERLTNHCLESSVSTVCAFLKYTTDNESSYSDVQSVIGGEEF